MSTRDQTRVSPEAGAGEHGNVAATTPAASRSDLEELYFELAGHAAREPRLQSGRRAARAQAVEARRDLLTPEELEQLEQQFLRDREGMLRVVRRTMGYPITEVEFRELIADGKQAVSYPREYARTLRMRRQFLEKECKAPADIPTYEDIEVKPCSRRFEGLADAAGWLFNCGPYWLQQKLGTLDVAPFVRHTDFSSGFVYTMKSQDDVPLCAQDTIRIALFSDFGTGEYHSLYVARAIERLRPHYAIHLGDVYYSGTPAEVEEHLEAPLEPLTAVSRVFALNANHEMLSGGFGYFSYLDRKRNSGAGVAQEQEGSYFCLRSDRYQVIALDTAYDYAKNGELTDPVQEDWLRARLAEGKNQQPPLVTILLTQHEPFGLGLTDEKPLFRQIEACAGANGSWGINFWFWGDEHYCVLYERSEAVPFVGSCIGHAGHPVDLREVKKLVNRESFARPQWVDTSSRFKTLRTDDLGNTGFCVLELESNGVRLTYHDWLGDEIESVSY